VPVVVPDTQNNVVEVGVIEGVGVFEEVIVGV